MAGTSPAMTPLRLCTEHDMNFLAAPSFLGTPDIGVLTFAALMLASLVTSLHRRVHRGGRRHRAARPDGDGDAAAGADPGAHRGDAGLRHDPHHDHVAARHAAGGAAVRDRRGDRRRGRREGVRRADHGVAGVHPRRVHPAGDVDAEARAFRRRARPLRRAGLRHHVRRRVRQRDRHAARAVRGGLDARSPRSCRHHGRADDDSRTSPRSRRSASSASRSAATCR